MRILAVSNLYPPHHIGGYELRCKDVVEGLRGRGHEVSVLTSMYGVSGPENASGLHRRLHLGGLSTLPKGSLLRAVSVEYRDQRFLSALVSELKPQLISVWNLAGLADGLLATIQQVGIPAVYDISDDWLIKRLHKNLWRRRSARRTTRMGKTVLRMLLRLLLWHSILPDPSDFKPAQCYFTSKALKERYRSWGFSMADARVIYCGVALDEYTPRKENASDKDINLLYVGQLEKHKGTHTVIEALARLISSRGVKGTRLSIVGTGRDPEYREWLSDIVTDANLHGHVEFVGKVPRHAMPRIYSKHNILVFPSIVEEAFSLTLLEAMASGLAVVATATGGSREILIDGWNSLIFQAEDADQLARQVERLIANDELRQHLSQNALKTVRPRFDITHMVDQIEEVFKEAISESMTEAAV